MNKAAIMSDDGRYRYLLERQWDERPLMAWCMLNPSTADANNDDPTIRRCMGFAQSEGFGGIIVVNLMAFRTRFPAICLAQDDPYGPLNDEYLRIAANRAAKGFVCAWGAHATKEAVDRAIRSLGKVCLWHLGLTKNGSRGTRSASKQRRLSHCGTHRVPFFPFRDPTQVASKRPITVGAVASRF